MNFSDCLLHGATTDVGMRRTNNQDSHAVSLADSYEQWIQRGHLFVVADGMGAHAAGELASKLAVEGVPHLFHKYKDLPTDEALAKSVRETNLEINRRGKANLDFHNMGTTLVSLSIGPLGAIVAHVGDSRVYRLRGDRFQQLTFDHSLVWEMRAAGHLPEDGDLAKAIPKNVITRSLGPYPTVQVDVEGPFPVELNDAFLLCSDGLSGPVTDAEIGLILGCLPPAEATRALADLANLRGGPDNVTVLAAKVVDPCLTSQVAGKMATVPAAAGKSSAWSPFLWATAAAAAGLAVVLWFLSSGQIFPTVVLGVLAAFSALFAAITQFGLAESTATVPRQGKGPYVETICKPDREHVKALAKAIAELRQAVGAGWKIGWERYDSLVASATQAESRGDFAGAVREHCRSLSFLMESLRAHGGPAQEDDESVL